MDMDMDMDPTAYGIWQILNVLQIFGCPKSSREYNRIIIFGT
jgi:hypothetical protein